MNDERLYIDGVLADLGEQTRITLSLNSNLFRDISKMAGNFSYTIKLPNTTHNRQLIEASDTLNISSLYPYGAHTADYYRNGVGVVIGAKAVLLSVGNDIEISLTWGFTDGLRRLASDGLAINQLKDPLSITWKTSGYQNAPNPIPLWATIENDPEANNVKILYAMSNYYRPAEDRYEESQIVSHGWDCLYIRPCVRVPYILHVIEQTYGVTLDFSAVQSLLANLAIPLTTIKAQFASDADTATIDGFASNPEGVFLQFTSNNGAGVFVNTPTQTDRLAVSTAKIVLLTLNITGTASRPQADQYAAGAVVRMVRFNSADVEQERTDIQIVMTDTTPSQATLSVTGDFSVNMAAGDYLKFFIASDTLDTIEQELVASVFSQGTGTIEGRNDTNIETYTDDVPEVQVGAAYPAFPNLPNVKVVDFIKTLCVMTGTFPKNQQGDTIEFLPFSVLWDNIPSAYDWTRRIEPAQEIDKPRELAYKMGEYAQNNWYRFTGEDDYEGNYDGNLPVPNTTLELTKDFFKIPFAPSPVSRFQRQVRIPIYSVSNYSSLIDGSETTPAYSAHDVKPRIVRLQALISRSPQTNPITQATFDGLSMAEAIATRYQDVQNALAYCMVIKERIRLSDIELQMFDETIPVYLAQYGAYFAVAEIKADDEGNADVTLFKIQ